MHTIILYNGSPGYYPSNWLNFMLDLVESNYKVFEWNKLSNIDKQQKINSELAKVCILLPTKVT
jgi:hypothetical protein